MPTPLTAWTHTPLAFDHAFAVLLAVLFPIRASWFGYRRLVRAAEADLPRVRLSIYRQAIAIQWTLVAITIALWIWRGRPWAYLGLVPVFSPGLAGVAFGLGVVAIMVWRQRTRALGDDEALAAVRKRMAHIERMLPRTPEELRRFNVLAITAGICEELLYRGYLIWYLAHWLGLIPAWLVASLVFGIGHIYQGVRGVLVTTAAGTFLGLVYLISGSLFPGMLIHALMDLHAGNLTYAAYVREREQESERAAAELA